MSELGSIVLWLRDVLVMVATGGLLLAVVRVPWVAGRTWRRTDTAAWWSNRQLVTALVSAGVLKPREGERLNLSYRGAPRHNDTGTTVTVALPQARTLTDVLARREALAAALRIPTARLEVTQGDDDPANVVTLRVGTDRPRVDVPAAVTVADRTTWTDPVRIGQDTHGRPVELATVEANTLVGGTPGAGKTALTQCVMGHYLLDPSTSVYALDGKGSTRDYGPARPLCARFVSGVDEYAVSDTLTMLTEVLDVVRARNASGEDAHPGLLLVLEELQDVRAAADKFERERLDVLLGRVVRMGRAVSVHVLISTQRPSVDDVPSGARNLLSQRVALMLRNGADAALVLGAAPSLPLPRRRGQALLATAAGTRAVTLDRLTEDAWRALCARAAALRGTNTPSLPRDMAEPSQALTAGMSGPADRANGGGSSEGEESPRSLHSERLAPVDPLLSDVIATLADMDPAGVTATDLHTALPDWTHELVPTPRDLGVELRRWPQLERVNRGKSRVWRVTGALTEDCRSTVGALPQRGLPDSRKGPVRAQVGASDSAGPKTAGVPRP